MARSARYGACGVRASVWECVRLAGAVGRVVRLESGSKLAALQTLRAIVAMLWPASATRAATYKGKVMNRRLVAVAVAVLITHFFGALSPLYADLRTGLVAYYPFNGNANDASGNGHDGTNNGAVLMTDRFGTPNAAYYFAGNGERISIADSPALQLTGGYTLAAWINFEAGGTYMPRIINKFTYSFWTSDTSAQRSPGMHLSGQNPWLYGPPILYAGIWYHVASSYNLQQRKLYVNGALVASDSYTLGVAVGNFPLEIGRKPCYGYDAFKGIIDDVRIYNRALSPSEVVQLYNTENGSAGPWITTQPTGQSAQAGANVALNVAASGTPPMSYQWLFNGATLPGATAATLTLSLVNSIDAGAYSVVVWNAYGSVVSAAAQLTVSQPLILPGTTLSPTVDMTTPALAFAPSPSQLKTFVNGSFMSGGPLAPGKMTIILTHGWIPAIEPVGLPGEGIGGWPTEMAQNTRLPRLWHHSEHCGVDWGDAARSFPCDPGQAAGQTQFQGPALGQALAAALGAYYSEPIHFIGHSLGTLLNASAANYLHSSGFAPSNTHMTLFDEAEIAADTGCSKFFALALYASPSATQAPYPPLPAHFAWADNYVSLVGQLQPGAANVILTNGLPSSAPNLSGLIEEANAFHGYPMLWYEDTIASPGGALMGFHWSFEEGGFSGAPAAGTVYVQAFNTSSLDLVKLQSYADGTDLLNQRFQTYHTTIATLGATAVAPGQSSGGVSGQANYSEYDEVNMTINLWASAAVGPVTPNVPLHPLGNTPQDNTVTNVPAYAWIPITIPSNAVAMSFNFVLQGNGQSDSFDAALNGTNVLAVPASLIQTNVTLSSGLVAVSQYGGAAGGTFPGDCRRHVHECSDHRKQLPVLQFYTAFPPGAGIREQSGHYVARLSGRLRARNQHQPHRDKLMGARYERAGYRRLSIHGHECPFCRQRLLPAASAVVQLRDR